VGKDAKFFLPLLWVDPYNNRPLIDDDKKPSKPSLRRRLEEPSRELLIKRETIGPGSARDC
jgi:hypothetical protein